MPGVVFPKLWKSWLFYTTAKLLCLCMSVCGVSWASLVGMVLKTKKAYSAPAAFDRLGAVLNVCLLQETESSIWFEPLEAKLVLLDWGSKHGLSQVG